MRLTSADNLHLQLHVDKFISKYCCVYGDFLKKNVL